MTIGGQRVMLADELSSETGVPARTEPVDDHFLTLIYNNAEDVKAAFSALVEGGGRLIFPLHSTTYCECSGNAFDRFGFRWGIMTE